MKPGKVASVQTNLFSTNDFDVFHELKKKQTTLYFTKDF